MTPELIEKAQQLDEQDPLKTFRERFLLPDNTIYLCGNSLGAMPVQARDIASECLNQHWAQNLTGSWNSADWFHLPQRLGSKLATLLGADADEVLVTDSVGINLYKVLAAALMLRPNRHTILMEQDNFPHNNYIADGLVKLLKKQHRIVYLYDDQILDHINEDTAAICLTHAHYKTGRLFDIEQLTNKAHQKDALAIWDLCHSAGVIPLALNRCHVDFAVGCTYKYLNGGPGSPAFIYAARRHHNNMQQPLTGWWGHQSPFAFHRDYTAANGIEKMLTGTQPILSMATLEAGINIALAADIHQVREKSLKLRSLFIEALEPVFKEYGFEIAGNVNGKHQGSQLAVRHPSAWFINKALIRQGVIGDYRSPDILRFGLAPLYNRYSDIVKAAHILRRIMEKQLWQQEDFDPTGTVT